MSERVMKEAIWTAVPVLLAALVTACDASPLTVKGISILTMEEHTASANGTWERPCAVTDTGMAQVVLQFSGGQTLISSQTFDAPAVDCNNTPATVVNVTGTSVVQEEPKEVTWLSDTPPVGVPDSLLASQIILTLDQAIGKTTALNVIAVIDDGASPRVFYLSRSDEATVTLDKSGFPNELNSNPFTRN